MSRRIDLPDDLVNDVERRAEQDGVPLDEAVARLLRAGLAAAAHPADFRVDVAMLEERRRIAEKFLSGEWGVDLDGFEEGREADRRQAAERNDMWRR